MRLRRDEHVASGRVRLEGRTQRRGAQTGLPDWGIFLFGAVFVAVGTGISLVGLKVLHVNPRGVHAPYWMLTVVGVVFALAGAALWSMGYKQYRARRYRQAALLQHPGEPAWIDYDWNPRESVSSGRKKAIMACAVAGFVTLFLSIFNYWAFISRSGDIPVRLVVGLLDLGLILVWWQAVVLLGRSRKFGRSRILFDRFPYRLSETVVIRWIPPSGVGTIRPGSDSDGKPVAAFTLRCVQEWFETRGFGQQRRQSMVHEEVWRGRFLADDPKISGEPVAFLPGHEIRLSFNPGPDALPTCLSADKPVFWEFEVSLDLPGFDFKEIYLVPVY